MEPIELPPVPEGPYRNRRPTPEPVELPPVPEPYRVNRKPDPTPRQIRMRSWWIRCDWPPQIELARRLGTTVVDTIEYPRRPRVRMAKLHLPRDLTDD